MINILLLKNLISQRPARLKQINLASKGDTADFVKKTYFNDKLESLNKKVTSDKTKHILIENKLKKLQIFESRI